MATGDYERHLHLQLRMLRESYEKAARPIWDELVKIERMRVRPLTIPREQYESVQHLLATQEKVEN